MAEHAIFRFQCNSCDEWHEGAPSVGFDAPDYYYQLNEAERAHAQLTTELCRLPHDEPPYADFFVHCLLEIPIANFPTPFLWSAWVSLSEANFADYQQRLSGEKVEDGVVYTGWLSNWLPGYPNTLSLGCRVLPQSGGLRPKVELMEADHPLYQHFSQQMPFETAQAIFEKIQHGASISVENQG